MVAGNAVVSKPKKAKNLCGKTRKVDNPYEVWKAGSWTWRVLKKWQADDNKPYARWFCAVKTPYTFGGYDMGDVYVQEIKGNAIKLTEQEMQEHLEQEKW